jgi:hypothetical protein
MALLEDNNSSGTTKDKKTRTSGLSRALGGRRSPKRAFVILGAVIILWLLYYIRGLSNLRVCCLLEFLMSFSDAHYLLRIASKTHPVLDHQAHSSSFKNQS